MEFCRWSKAYAKYGPYAQPPNIRYYIGFYQIGQGISWAGTDSEYESWASAAVHMVGAVELLHDQAGVEQHLPRNLLEIEHARIDHRRLLFLCARAMQQVHYGFSCMGTIHRKNRFDLECMVRDVADIVSMLFSAIPVVKRAQAVEDATALMTGVI